MRARVQRKGKKCYLWNPQASTIALSELNDVEMSYDSESHVIEACSDEEHLITWASTADTTDEPHVVEAISRDEESIYKLCDKWKDFQNESKREMISFKWEAFMKSHPLYHNKQKCR